MTLFLLLLLACGGDDEATDNKQAADALGANHQVISIDLKGEAGKLDVEVQQISLFDSSLHQFSGPADVDASKPGPRVVAVGRIHNGTAEHIVTGGVFAKLEICLSDKKEDCVVKSSHDRGFVLSLSAQDPWRPGEWRQFVAISRPHKSFYRELSPISVRGSVEIDLEGAFGLEVKTSLWRDDIAWSTLGGQAMDGHFTLTENRRIARRKFKLGTSFQVLGMSGMHVALQQDGRRMWGSMRDVPEAYSTINSATEPITLPHTIRTEDIEITIKSLESKVIQDVTTDRATRYAVIDVEAIGKRERAVRIRSKDFMLLLGNLSEENTTNDKNVVSRPMSFERLATGESHAGKIAFKCPYGVNPLRLHIKFQGTQIADFALPPLE
jgi:hypothetical protein